MILVRAFQDETVPSLTQPPRWVRFVSTVALVFLCGIELTVAADAAQSSSTCRHAMGRVAVFAEALQEVHNYLVNLDMEEAFPIYDLGMRRDTRGVMMVS
jgi:hypothetical protein